MTKLILTLLTLLALAAPALAYVQTGHLPSDNPQSIGRTAQPTIGQRAATPTATNLPRPGDTRIGLNGDDDDDDDDPVHPVPEPGTMALASMGLLALGAAARKRNRR